MGSTLGRYAIECSVGVLMQIVDVSRKDVDILHQRATLNVASAAEADRCISGRSRPLHQRPKLTANAADSPAAYLVVGIVNSAPLGVLSGQRCMMDFWRV
jgi:hypothetical protein